MKAMFDEYHHSLPMIYSALEKQYNYNVIDISEQTKILCTVFDYNYISGDIPEQVSETTDKIKSYIIHHNMKEFILFGPNKKWDNFLTKTIHEINGVIDERSMFSLNVDKFYKKYNSHTFRYNVHLIDEQDNNSNIIYKSAVVFDGDNIIGYSKGFMIGKNNVEIDVYTNELNRRKGIAYETSLVMIKYLLDNNYLVNWTCWRAKESSQKLAKKLGFDFVENIKAYIWVEDFSL